jgi:hypothetical protein
MDKMVARVERLERENRRLKLLALWRNFVGPVGAFPAR